MTRLNIYSAKGVKKDGMSLPKRFVEKENLTLLAQALRVYAAGKHPGLSKTKSRGEVSLSKRKIWRQKGTGRARHGAKSAPIFVGGGVAHGPDGEKRHLTLPKKMRKKALNAAISLKAGNGEIVIVDGLSLLKKTKEAADLLKKVATKEKYKQGRNYTVALADENVVARLALRNLENVKVVRFSDLNAYSVYFAGVLIIDKKALEESKTNTVGKAKKSGRKNK